MVVTSNTFYPKGIQRKILKNRITVICKMTSNVCLYIYLEIMEAMAMFLIFDCADGFMDIHIYQNFEN